MRSNDPAFGVPDLSPDLEGSGHEACGLPKDVLDLGLGFDGGAFLLPLILPRLGCTGSWWLHDAGRCTQHVWIGRGGGCCCAAGV